MKCRNKRKEYEFTFSGPTYDAIMYENGKHMPQWADVHEKERFDGMIVTVTTEVCKFGKRECELKDGDYIVTDGCERHVFSHESFLRCFEIVSRDDE